MWTIKQKANREQLIILLHLKKKQILLIWQIYEKNFNLNISATLTFYCT